MIEPSSFTNAPHGSCGVLDEMVAGFPDSSRVLERRALNEISKQHARREYAIVRATIRLEPILSLAQYASQNVLELRVLVVEEVE